MAQTQAAAVERSGPGAFYWGRLGSFLGLLPLGVWTVNHLWDNLAAFQGAAAWEAQVTAHEHPVGHALTVVLVFLPLLLHAAWGLQRLFAARPNNLAYRGFDNLKYLLQRASAVGALFFIGAHVWQAMLRPRLIQGAPETFADISHHMRNHPPTLVVYLLGTLAVAYHLANGLSSFAWTWGLSGGRRSFRRYDVLAIAVFLLLLLFAWGAIYAMYRAAPAA